MSNFRDDNHLNPHTSYQVHTRYIRDEGLIQVPVAAPPRADGSAVPCEIIRTHAPCEKKVVTWAGERLGEHPFVPQPAPQSSNEVLGNRVFGPLAPKPTGEGNAYAYGAEGEYTYFCIVPHDVAHPFFMGRQPYDATSGVNHHFSLQDYDTDIIPPS